MVKRIIKEEKLKLVEGQLPNFIKSSPKVRDAVEKIISSRTMPPQIDYISPGDKQKVKKAEEFLETLPTGLSKKCFDYIDSEVDQYHGEDGAGQYDSMF